MHIEKAHTVSVHLYEFPKLNTPCKPAPQLKNQTITSCQLLPWLPFRLLPDP